MKAGILGYGNLGRGVEAAINKNEDMELVAVYTRRDPAGLKICTPGASVKHIDALADGKEDIDVLIICGGSATDLPEMTLRIFRSTSAQSTRPRRPAGRSASSPAAGIRACSR